MNENLWEKYFLNAVYEYLLSQYASDYESNVYKVKDKIEINNIFTISPEMKDKVDTQFLAASEEEKLKLMKKLSCLKIDKFVEKLDLRLKKNKKEETS